MTSLVEESLAVIVVGGKGKDKEGEQREGGRHPGQPKTIQRKEILPNERWTYSSVRYAREHFRTRGIRGVSGRALHATGDDGQHSMSLLQSWEFGITKWSLKYSGKEKKVQTNKQKSTNHLKGRSKTDLKYPHTSCGEMTEQFLHSSEEKTARQG